MRIPPSTKVTATAGGETIEVTDTIDARTLAVMMATAAYQARRVARKLKLSRAEREDAEQEILLALLERRRYFDPARGPWTPFAYRIAGQAAQSVADGLMAARKLYEISLDPLEVAAEDDEEEPGTLADTRSDERSESESAILHSLSMMRFVAELPAELRLVAEAALAADGDLAEAQRATGLSTSEFYRRLREVRYRMFTLGLVDHRPLLNI